MADKIRAKITAANSTFQVLRLDRCLNCLLSNATAVHTWADNLLVCQHCEHPTPEPNLEIHR